MAKPSMPTYLSAAEVLERKTGAGWRLVGWTLLRTLLIAPPILIITPSEYRRRVWVGAAMSSILISSLAMLRILNAGQNGLGAPKRRRPRKLLRA